MNTYRPTYISTDQLIYAINQSSEAHYGIHGRHPVYVVLHDEWFGNIKTILRPMAYHPFSIHRDHLNLLRLYFMTLHNAELIVVFQPEVRTPTHIDVDHIYIEQRPVSVL